jgi:hypothetical protein
MLVGPGLLWKSTKMVAAWPATKVPRGFITAPSGAGAGGPGIKYDTAWVLGLIRCSRSTKYL